MADWIEVAKVAYAAYGSSTGNKNFRGEEMPTWDGLTPEIRIAWAEAVHAAIEFANRKPSWDRHP
jgi:hypothetical protein